jgi:two-component system, sensor histidine kinase YesM
MVPLGERIRGFPRSIRWRVLLHISLIVIAIASLTVYDFLADRRLQELDIAALHEQITISEIYEEIGRVRDVVDMYVTNPHPVTRQNYDKLSRRLSAEVAEFASIERSENGERTAVDFHYMVVSFLEAASRTMAGRQIGELGRANDSYRETANVFDLIHRQLTDLFQVMNEDNARQKAMADRVRREIVIVDVALCLAIAALVALFFLQVLKRIIEPLDGLTKAAIDVNAGGLQIRVEEGSQDFEIEKLSCAFNAMLETIQGQIVELREASELKAHLHEEELKGEQMRTLMKESELQALQSRINPHFLFNTLNMICQMAYSEKATGSAALLEALSAMLRYIMAESSKPVSIDEEMSNVRDYIYIQNLRFGDRIGFELQYDEDVGKAIVPRLIVQPLVENAVVHGVKALVRGATVRIGVSADERSIRIRVVDNGVGIDAETLAAVRASVSGRGMEGEGIGLRNIYERLRLFCGEGAQLRVDSDRGRGTCVELVIPRGDGATT